MTEPVSPYIFHLVLIRQWRYSAGGILSVERFIKKVKIRESSSNREIGFMKGFEIGLHSQLAQSISSEVVPRRDSVRQSYGSSSSL